MQVRGVVMVGVLTAGMALAQAPLTLPSGVMATPFDQILDEGTGAIRMRFLVPALAEPASIYSGDPDRVFEDMLWLCETQVRALFPLPADPRDEGWDSVVVTLMDRPVEFGVMAPDAMQLFEGFALTMDGCDFEDEFHD
jgi:hypothetical protein